MGWWKQLQDYLHPPPPRRIPRPRVPDYDSSKSLLRIHPDGSSSTVNSFTSPDPSPLSSPVISTRSSSWNLSAEKLPLHRSSQSESSSLRPTLAYINRIVYRYFYQIIVILFLVTATVVGISLFDMVHAPTQLVEAHDRIISGGKQPGTTAPAPSMWDRFPLLEKYYVGLFSLVPENENIPEYPQSVSLDRQEKMAEANDHARSPGVLAKSRVFNPYPKYDSQEYRSEWAGEYVECSFGKLRSATGSNYTRKRPEVRAFDGTPAGMPNPIFGSNALLGLDEDVCFERYGKLGAYGYGYGEEDGGLGVGNFHNADGTEIETGRSVGAFPLERVDWRGVDWGKLQEECMQKNSARFLAIPERPDSLYPGENPLPRRTKRNEVKTNKKLPRTAVLLRTWSGYDYTPDDIASLRSLISELSILSGGEYTIHILVHVRDNAVPIWSGEKSYRRALESSKLPEEFWGLAELWNEALMRAIYSKIPDPAGKYQDYNLAEEQLFMKLPLHGAYRSTFMPVQWFAHRHPEYDFVWNWEMDVRYTGHFYHLFQKTSRWARKQPRRHLWERSARFFVPEVHGSWDKFSAMVAERTPFDESIWGAVNVSGVTAYPNDPLPPKADVESWGVDEDADLISFNPLFDPEGTNWILRHDTSGYGYEVPPPRGSSPTGPPRRTAVITASRLSRRLLETMHIENAVEGHAMFSEMWPASVALHHGLKAVYVPHAVYVDRKWPLPFLEKTFNNGAEGSAGGSKKSVFGSREHNFQGSTWYYNAGFARKLYRRWLGIDDSGPNGTIVEAAELAGGRMCLKGLLAHPVKAMGERTTET